MNIGHVYWTPSLNGHRFTVVQRQNRYFRRRKLISLERMKAIYHREKEQDKVKRPRN